MRLFFFSIVGSALLLNDGLALDVDQKNRLARWALAQSTGLSPEWDPSQRDCSGFIRFLYRKSTLSLSDMWKDGSGKNVHYVSADRLIGFNFSPLGKALSYDRLETGDVLAYFHPGKPSQEAWHLMVVIEPVPGGPQRWLAMYHNGQTGKQGKVKKIWLDELAGTSLSEWRMSEENPLFVGAFRWLGKDEGKRNGG